MGMAASQARFLGLTARKSNIEFQGQQINQARTALSNEVMGLYGKYSSLEVPVAPTKYDYIKTTYSIDSTYENYEIKDFSKITSGENQGFYSVTLTCDDEIPEAYNATIRNTVVSAQKDDENDYSYLNFTIGTNSYTYDKNNEKDSTITKITGNYNSYSGLSTIMKSQGYDPSDSELGKTYYSFSMNGTTYFVSEDDLDSTAFQTKDDKQEYYGDFTFDYQGVRHNQKEVNAIASLTQASNGRLATINVISCEDDKDLEGKAYSITTGQEDDEDGYLDAMNKYNYEKDNYEKKLQDLNAKIEKIQTQDKALELKLAQLDTEQEAVAKEMDSVSKVVNDTIDKLFDSSN